MIRLRATYEIEYEADPADYYTDDPLEMAEIDRENFRDDPSLFFDGVVSMLNFPQATDVIRVRVEPITPVQLEIPVAWEDRPKL